MKRSFLSFLSFVLLQFYANATVYQGNCGDQGNNVTYKLDTSTKELTISGSGKMCDYKTAGTAPWYGYRESITKIIINNGVSSIGEFAFYRCTSAERIDIPRSVAVFGDLAFQDCWSLDSIPTPGVEEIGMGCFSGCKSLKSLQLPWFLKRIGTSITEGCISLEEITVESENWNFDSRRKCNAIIHTRTGTLYAGCKNTYIPEGVTSIAQGAFARCSTLSSITIPSSVSQIGTQAFYECTGLKTIISKATTSPSCGLACFYSVDPTTEIHVPFESIESYASSSTFGSFANIDAIQTVHAIPVNTIRYTADSKVDVLWPDYDDNEGCDEDIDWYNDKMYGVHLVSHEFSNGQGVITFNKPVTYIHNYMFSNKNITSVELPSEVEYIGEEAFNHCSKLNAIELPSSMKVLDERVFINSGVEHVALPDGLKKIEREAFWACYSLKEISIPQSVTSLGFVAFGHCEALKKIFVYSPTPINLSSNITYSDIYSSCALYVPKNTSGTYASAIWWSDFAAIKENHFDMTTDTQIDITISSAKWSTMILPYDAVIPTNMTVYACDASDGDILTLEEQSEIKANIPYLVYGEPGTYIFNAVGSAWEDTYTDGWLTGAYIETDVPEDSYILAKVNDIVGFYKVTGTNVGKAKIAPYHCYLTSETPTGQAKARFLLSDDTTGISAITNADSSKAVITDLAGRRLNSPAKGINIINGVKVMIK